MYLINLMHIFAHITGLRTLYLCPGLIRVEIMVLFEVGKALHASSSQ